jgi:hypothetical protein
MTHQSKNDCTFVGLWSVMVVMVGVTIYTWMSGAVPGLLPETSGTHVLVGAVLSTATVLIALAVLQLRLLISSELWSLTWLSTLTVCFLAWTLGIIATGDELWFLPQQHSVPRSPWLNRFLLALGSAVICLCAGMTAQAHSRYRLRKRRRERVIT